ncbi:MAG: hypothetical protein EOO11_00335 [Chitinophagaceae bacterium]|nr:MAG: hypothetical protein EOO11_00335 [Chitinophagaceae bacterium]
MSTPFFPEAFVHALLWTLVHSLWIGTLAALVAGAIVAATRRRSPALRYNGLLLAGTLFLAATAGSFFYYISRDSNGAGLPLRLPSGTVAVATSEAPGFYGSWTSVAAAFIDRHAVLLVGLWTLLLAARALRLAGSYYSLRVLRTRALRPAGSAWQERLRELCARIGVRHPVPLFESGLARVPMIVGCLKPVLLVPAGFLSGLPPESVEAVLLHELAHLRRRDHLVNAVQLATELLFFFNPAVLWISKLLRTEREHCCDDLAVRHSGNTRGYINALVAFQEHGGIPAGALAFAGREMPLLDRIKRLIHQKNKPLNNMEKTVLLAGLLAIGMAASAFYQQQPPTPPKPPAAPAPVAATPPPPPAPDTTGRGSGEIQYSDGSKTYRFRMEDNRLAGVSVNGVAVPQDKIAGYEELFRTALKGSRKAQAEARVHQEKADRMHAEAEAHHHKAAELQERVQELNAATEALEEQPKTMEVERLTQARHAKHSDSLAREQVAISRAHEKMTAEHARMAKEHQRLSREHEALARAHEKEAQVHAAVHRELVKDGLIKENNPVSISFDGDSLVIDGVKQPAEVARKYRKLVADEKARLGIR